MFTEVSKVFDRNFVIGHLLPVTAFVAASLAIFRAFGLFVQLLPQTQTDVLLYVGLISSLGGIVLLVVNRAIYAFMEGYGFLNPLRLLAPLERASWRRLVIKVARTDAEYREYVSNKQPVLRTIHARRIQLMTTLAERFPIDAESLASTSFGNRIRAFEDYPVVMYGFDSTFGWPRLQTVIPKEYRELIDSAKSQTDFWVNLWFLSLLLIGECLVIFIYMRQVDTLSWVILGPVLVTWVSYSNAASAASEWGNLMKSSFDIFLPELRKKLGFAAPKNREEERELWLRFSQAISYKSVAFIPAMEQASVKDQSSSPTP